MPKYIPLIFILLMSICISLQAQSHFVFTPIDSKAGLSENRVRNIQQLQDGRMVIITEGVTNIYDGATFKHLHLSGKNTIPLTGYTGFHHSYVTNDFVWIKNNGKLMVMDVKRERFVERPDSLLSTMGFREPIADLFLDAAQNYWIRTSSDDLLYRDARKGKTILFRKHISFPYGVKDELYDVAVVRKQVFLFFRYGVMVCCDLNTGRELYKTDAFPGEEKQRYNRTLMVVSSGDMLYQLRNGAGGSMLGYDIRQRKWSTILKTDYWLNTLSADNQGNLWVSCQTGLWNMDKSLQQKQFIPSFHLIDGSEIDTEVSAQYTDTQGGLWLGTYNRGLLYYHADRFRFRNIGISALGPQIKKLDVNGFAGNERSGVLIATSGGLFRYEVATNSINRVKAIPADANTVSLMQDSRQRIWLCTQNRGLYCLQKDKIIHFDQTINQLYQVSDGQIFAATNQGLGILNPATASIRYLPLPAAFNGQNSISQIINLDKNRLLGSGNMGLFIYDLQKQTFSRVSSPFLQNGNQQYNSLFRDRKGQVWIGTQDGLIIWLPQKQQFYRLYTDDGLVNNSVKGLAEDRQGRIWVTTSGGVSCITAIVTNDKPLFSFSNFNHYDGVIGNEFTSRAIYMTPGGVLLMGGVNGFNALDLQKPWAYTRLPRPVFTDLLLFGEKVKPGTLYDGNTILPRPIPSMERIVLKHNQNFISLEFSALNYVNPTQTYFRYRLEGIDEKWREVSSSSGTGTATYTNLSPGTYRFQVKSANNSKVWTAGYSEIRVEVKAPFWKTPLAYFIYLILIAALLFILLKYYQQQTHQRMARRNEEQLNRMKFNFFTNISHEFRTPLTLIITPLESWLKEAKGTPAEARIRSLYRHARDLQNLVNQLLDFRRLEVSGEKLNLTFGNIVDFVGQFEELFSRLGQEKHIVFSVKSEPDELYCYFDREKLYRILNNLLSNAFKFTPEEGQISVLLSRQEEDGKEYLEIRVSDTGKGIPQDELVRIFDRFYQANGTEQGSGIGLHLVKEYVGLHSGQINVESQQGRGATFTLRIPADLTPETTDGQISPEEVIGQPDATEMSIHSDKKYKLLVVEDNQELRHFLVSELSKSYEVLEASDGIAGKSIASEALPDLVISDVMMPGMDGLELCRQLKSDLQTSHIPVILLTARTSDEHKLEGYRSGADEYLPKPFNLDILHLRINKLIEQQRKRQQQFSHKIEVNPKEITITSLDEKLVEKALSCIERNMDNPEYSVQQFSEEMGMDRTVLYKKLQSITGLAPSEFIRSIRLKRAAQLLAQGQFSVSEVADMVGFNTQRYFSNYFREAFGMTPSQYIQNNRKK